ncbi:MAG: hypothetical protein DMF60_13900, partial [Acidobacteria bacterium]
MFYTRYCSLLVLLSDSRKLLLVIRQPPVRSQAQRQVITSRASGEADSPDQGVPDLSVDTITFKDSYLRFEMKDIDANFDGGLSRDGSEISGQFRQGSPLPLLLKRDGSAPNSNPPDAPGFMRG